MPYDSKADLEVRLSEIRVEIAKARKVLSYSLGSSEVTVTRTNLRSLLDEERWVLDQIAKADSVSGNSGGISSRIRFGRPV